MLFNSDVSHFYFLLVSRKRSQTYTTMSTSISAALDFTSQEIVIYLGLFFFIAGVIGGPLVLIVFLSLKTFRESSCAFYLTIMSFVNISHLFTGLLTFIMINGFGINWTAMSTFYCKFRPFYVQVSVLLSFTCMCMAIIDQFLATCAHPRWHRWNSIKLARYILIGSVFLWILHGIPFLMYYNITLSPITGNPSCGITNAIFMKYTNVYYIPFLTSSIPLTTMIIFGCLAYRNVQHLAYRTVPLVRRELDKQLTKMVLVQVFCDIFAVMPQVIYSICSAVIGTPDDLLTLILLDFIRKLASVLNYFRFSVRINHMIKR